MARDFKRQEDNVFVSERLPLQRPCGCAMYVSVLRQGGHDEGREVVIVSVLL